LSPLPDSRVSAAAALRRIDEVGPKWHGFSADREGGCSVLTCFGARIRVCSNDVGTLHRLSLYLPPAADWKPAARQAVDDTYTLHVGNPVGRTCDERRSSVLHRGAVVARYLDPDEAVERLASLVHFSFATHARRYLYVHAGVVAWAGHAAVFPGESCTGKSSLIAALVRAGATYYSDEYAVFDAAGLVHPYARAIALREPGQATARYVTAAMLGGACGGPPVPVILTVLTRYVPEARWRPRAVAPSRAVLTLIRNTPLAQSRGDQAIRVLARALQRASAITGRRGEAADVADRLVKRLGQLVDRRAVSR
jgi:hypothetical protein